MEECRALESADDGDAGARQTAQLRCALSPLDAPAVEKRWRGRRPVAVGLPGYILPEGIRAASFDRRGAIDQAEHAALGVTRHVVESRRRQSSLFDGRQSSSSRNRLRQLGDILVLADAVAVPPVPDDECFRSTMARQLRGRTFSCGHSGGRTQPRRPPHPRSRTALRPSTTAASSCATAAGAGRCWTRVSFTWASPMMTFFMVFERPRVLRRRANH